MDYWLFFQAFIMQKIFLVRHSATTLNEQHRYCGASDVSLSNQGLFQAQLIGQYLSFYKFTSIYFSPLKRSLETTDTIAQFHEICPEPLADLREIDFGLWEGLTFEEIQTAYPDMLNIWLENHNDFTFPKGESIDDFRKRVLLALKTVLSRQGDSLIVAHGGSLRIIICYLCGWGMECLHSFELEPASVTILEHYDKSTVVRVLNDTCHLKRGEGI